MRDPAYAPLGHFCWPELATRDIDSAMAFYGSLFGWGCVDMPTAMGNYILFKHHGLDVAAAYQMGPQQEAPPHWNAYVAVKNADASAAKAVELGGRVIAGPFNVEGIGRMAFVMDPGGATFALWQSIQHFGAGIFGESNSLCWTELMTRDPEQATAFYSGLFRWEPEAKESDELEYTEWWLHGTAVGGMITMDRAAFDDMPSQWMSYFAVDDCDAKAAAAKTLGAIVLSAPTDIPDIGRFAVIRDPQGAMFCIIKPLKS